MWGLSLHIDLYGCCKDKITNKEVIERFAKELVAELDMYPHGEPAIEWFGNDDTEGFTMVQLLTTSSITAHFSLKYRSSAYIDIFSCKEYNAGNIVMFCARYFDATLYESTAIIRGSTKHGPKRTKSVLEKNPA